MYEDSRKIISLPSDYFFGIGKLQYKKTSLIYHHEDIPIMTDKCLKPVIFAGKS